MRNKRVIKVPAAQAGQSVRWTLEVSADVNESSTPAARPTGKAMSAKRDRDRASRKAARRKANRQPIETTDANAFREAVQAMPLADHSVPTASDHRAFQRHFDQPAVDQGESKPAPVPEPVATASAMDAEDVEIVFDDLFTVDTPLLEESPAMEPEPAMPVAAAPVATAPTPTAPPIVPTAVPTRRPVMMSKRAKMMAVAAGCALMIGALALARDPSSGASVGVSAAPASPVASAEATTPEPEATPVIQQARAADLETPAPARTALAGTPALAAGTRPAAKTIAEKAATQRDARVITAALAPATVAPATIAPATPPPTAEPSANDASAAAAAAAATLAAGPAAVTITGCLEGTTDGDQFRLTETDGDAAPKARGWRSGFLKKKSAAVALTAADTSAFKKYVGQRVMATGVLASKEMRVRSFQPTGAMCD